jgi:hypothetical protein
MHPPPGHHDWKVGSHNAQGMLRKKRSNTPHASKNMGMEKQSAEMIRGENVGALGNYPNP